MQHYLTSLIQSIQFGFHNYFCNSISDGLVIVPTHEILIYWCDFFILGRVK